MAIYGEQNPQKEGDLVWLTEESDKLDNHILARVTDNIGGSTSSYGQHSISDSSIERRSV